MNTDETSLACEQHSADPVADYLYKERWLRELRLSTDEIVPAEDRLAVTISAEAIESLIYHLAERWDRPKAEALAWDLRRTDADDLGWDAFSIAIAAFGETPEKCWIDDGTGGRICDPTDYLNRAWEACDRERRPGDVLLIDLMDEATHRGWEAPPEIATDIAYLRSIAATRRAEREAQREADWAAWAEAGNRFVPNPDERPKLSFTPLPIILPQGIPVPSNVISLQQPKPLPDLIQSSADFVRDFTPPDYLVEGVLQKRFCYSATARTGDGKTAIAMRVAAHVATGRMLGNLEVAQGSVLYMAGENPTDVQMRWLGLTQAMGIDPSSVDVHFLAGAFPLSDIAERVTSEVQRKALQPALVVVDTSAAYNFGDDENSNAQAGAHARQLRSLTTLPGGPCVVVLSHPTKRAADDDLIPRGGGAFLAEVDGNLAIRKADSLVVITAQGKFRGPEFPPLAFELATVTHPRLRDTRGRSVPTVIARPVDDAAKTQLESTNRRDEDDVLQAIDRAPNASLSDLARQLGWFLRNSSPHHMKVKRATIVLQRQKLVEEHRGGWRLTQKGQRELNDMDRSQQIIPAPQAPK